MRFWLVLWTLFVGLHLARADETYRTYQNARFGYSIVYPSSLLVPQPEADNGDGRKFRSRDRRITLSVYGTYNALNRTHSQEFNRAQAAWKTDGAKITLSKITPQHFALSGFIDNNIFYEKTVFYGDKFCTMIWEYPQDERQRLDASVNRSFASFSPSIWNKHNNAIKRVQAPKPAATSRPSIKPRPTPTVARKRPVATLKPRKPTIRRTPSPRPTAAVGVDAGTRGGY